VEHAAAREKHYDQCKDWSLLSMVEVVAKQLNVFCNDRLQQMEKVYGPLREKNVDLVQYKRDLEEFKV